MIIIPLAKFSFAPLLHTRSHLSYIHFSEGAFESSGSATIMYRLRPYSSAQAPKPRGAYLIITRAQQLSIHLYYVFGPPARLSFPFSRSCRSSPRASRRYDLRTPGTRFGKMRMSIRTANGLGDRLELSRNGFHLHLGVCPSKYSRPRRFRMESGETSSRAYDVGHPCPRARHFLGYQAMGWSSAACR